MPELPEVETVRAGLSALLTGATLNKVVRHRKDLRRVMPVGLDRLTGKILAVRRRAKYLCIDLPVGGLLSHLGMTGSWRIADETPRLHDHLSLFLDDGRRLVYHDPRRFGVVDLLRSDGGHADLDGLGPEPLAADFTGMSLWKIAKTRRIPVKVLIMDQAVVVGVGNIYAAESLFRAGIDPRRPAERLSRADCERLVDSIRTVLSAAIQAGGSTISDYRNAGGDMGLFQLRFQVYGRAGEPCRTCKHVLRGANIGGRASVWCPICQR